MHTVTSLLMGFRFSRALRHPSLVECSAHPVPLHRNPTRVHQSTLLCALYLCQYVCAPGAESGSEAHQPESRIQMQRYWNSPCAMPTTMSWVFRPSSSHRAYAASLCHAPARVGTLQSNRETSVWCLTLQATNRARIDKNFRWSVYAASVVSSVEAAPDDAVAGDERRLTCTHDALVQPSCPRTVHFLCAIVCPGHIRAYGKKWPGSSG